MDGFSNKDMIYGILGATLSDKRSDSDAKLPRNELAKIGLINAMSAASKNPVFSMLTAKLAADSKIEAATALARNVALEEELRNIKKKIISIQKLADNEITTKFKASFDPDGHVIAEKTNDSVTS